jgi:hypothetical protein
MAAPARAADGDALWIGGDLTLATSVPEAGPASFEIDDVNLLVRYEPLPRLSFFSETRLEDTFKVSEDESAQTHAEVKVERLYADWIAGPHFTLRVGKFLTPFGVWNQIRRAPLTWTVERPLATELTFPEHTIGLGALYQATLSGWTVDATAYGPAQDTSLLRDSKETAVTLVGGRMVAAHQLGAAYLSVGLNVAGAERNHHGGLQPVAGADVNLSLAGNDLLGELVYARSPQGGGRDQLGYYLQDAVPLRDDLYAVARYEHFRPSRGGTIDAGLIGIAWRIHSHVIIKADYQFTANANSSEDVPRGLLASFALFF